MPGSDFEAQKLSKQDKKILKYLRKSPKNDSKSTFWIFFNF